MEEYRVEVCIVLRQLERLDKDEFTEDERADAEEVSENTSWPSMTYSYSLITGLSAAEFRARTRRE